jgi:RND family efflux transporter MFP subunit
MLSTLETLGKFIFRPSSLPTWTFAIAIFAFVLGCARAQSESPPPAEVAVVVTSPIKKQIVEWDEYVGRLDPVEFVEVRARVGGYLQSIHFVEGQIVTKGDLLCVIDRRPFVAELNRAKAELEQAKARVSQSVAQIAQARAEQSKADASVNYDRRRLDRSKTLLAKNTVTKDEFELQQSQLLQSQADVEGAKAQMESSLAAIATAKAAVETAQAAVGIADLNLEYTRVTAPVTGRVSRRDVTEGNLISGGTLQSTLLTTIVSLDPIHCYFDADEQAFLKYARLAQEGKRQSSRDVKNPVYIALGDEKNSFPHWGHMDFVDNRLDLNTGTMRARAIFRNPDLFLTPGLFARLRLPGSGRYEGVLAPDSAIGNDQSEKFVFVVGDDNKIRRQVVQIGPVVHGLRVIRSGLDGSEKIVLRGLQRVRIGLLVVPTFEAISAKDNEGLPDDYEPVPKAEWISIRSNETGNGDRSKSAHTTAVTRAQPVSTSTRPGAVNGY